MSDAASPRTATGRAETTRAALLNAAMHLFHERGYAQTTAVDIASAVGQTKGAFYFHFASKEECFLEVLGHREALRGTWYDVPGRFDAATTDLDEVLQATTTELVTTMDGLDSWILAVIDFRLQTGRDDAATSALSSIRDGWVAEISVFVENLAAGGWIHPELDTAHVAAQLLAFMDGISVHRRVFDADTTPLAFDGLRKLLAP